MAVSVGIATLPVSLPMMIAGRAVSGPGRLLFDYLDAVNIGSLRGVGAGTGSTTRLQPSTPDGIPAS